MNNGDGTVTDRATGLMWQKADDGTARNWEDSLAYAENLQLAGYSDWRLPNQKELHSIVDYGYIPAINPIFNIADPKAWFWSSTPVRLPLMPMVRLIISGRSAQKWVAAWRADLKLR